MQQRRRLIAILSILGILAITSWLIALPPERPLWVGIHHWIGYETLFLVREMNWLPADVQFRDGKTATDSLMALEAEQIDAACLTLDEVLRARARGLPLAIVLVFDASAGADVVLARPGIRKLSDLSGKRLGIERNALGALVLDKLLEVSGLPASAITLVDLPPDRQLAAWRNGTVDAVISYQPTADLLMREGAHPLFDSRQMPETIFDVLAVRSDRMRQHADALQELIAAHFRALDHLRTYHQDAVYRIAASQGITPEEVQQALAGVVLPSLAINRAYLTHPDSRLVNAIRTLSSLMVKRGLLPRPETFEGLVTPAWLPWEDD